MTSVYSNNKLQQDKENDAWTKLFELVPANAKVLDVGCSSGNFGAELIAKKQCNVIGIDINKSDIDLAKNNLNAAYVKDIENEDLNNLGTFDVIIMADVIEHLLRPIQALDQLKKLLNKGGKLIFSVPNMANMATRLELLEGRCEYTKFGLLDETHLHYYDRVQLELVLHNAGFNVLSYNNTIRDVPEPVAEYQLNKLGLAIKNPGKFARYLSSIDSVTFQFIGVATVSDSPHSKIASKTPHDFMSTFIDTLNAKTKQLSSELKTTKQMLKIKENELAEIYNSNAWKSLVSLRAAKHKLTKRR